LVILVFATNMGVLWGKKHSQFVARAAPTDQLLALAKTTNKAPIWVRCFPRARSIAEDALRIMMGTEAPLLVWSAEDAQERHAEAEFCYTPRQGRD
jgi:hypothetical protein